MFPVIQPLKKCAKAVGPQQKVSRTRTTIEMTVRKGVQERKCIFCAFEWSRDCPDHLPHCLAACCAMSRSRIVFQASRAPQPVCSRAGVARPCDKPQNTTLLSRVALARRNGVSLPAMLLKKPADFSPLPFSGKFFVLVETSPAAPCSCVAILTRWR